MKFPLKFGNVCWVVWMYAGRKNFCIRSEVLIVNKMTSDWRPNLVLMYKKNGDIQNNTNCCGNKLSSYTMKLWQMVTEHGFRHETKIFENQLSFMLKQSIMETIFLLRN